MFAVWLYINTRSHSPRKNYQPLFTDYLIITSFEKNSNVKSVVNSIPSRFLKFGSRCWKLHLHTGFNVYTEYRESSGGSQFVTKSFSMCWSWSNAISVSDTKLTLRTIDLLFFIPWVYYSLTAIHSPHKYLLETLIS